ncbi:CbtA family protein [Nocardia goodfellowii]
MPLTSSTPQAAGPLAGTLKTLLLRGLLAGLIAGLLAATVGYFVGEPKIEAAIAIEEAAGGHTHGVEEEPLVSRAGQRAGQFLALGLAGLALGAIFAAVAHVGRRHTTMPGPAFALALALGGWAAIVAVPFFKYPANPPAVGDPETIGDRTWLWVAAVVLGLVAVGAGVFVHRLLHAQPGSFRLIGAVAAFVAIVTAGYLALPGIDEVKADFPAGLLWEFRVSSLAVSATLWACLGLAFAALTEFATRTSSPVRDEAATAG